MAPRNVVLLALALGFTPPALGEIRVPGAESRPARIPDALLPAARPVVFEANRGQTDPSVRFLARPRGCLAFFTGDGVVWSLPHGTVIPSPSLPECDVLRMSFPGARPSPAVRGLRPMASRSHYLLGADPGGWTTDVPQFGGVEYAGLWEGVDLRWREGAGRSLEYDLVVRPGADPDAVSLSFEGARSVEVDARGDLVLRTAGGILRHGRPVAWEEGGGARVPVEASFRLRADGTVGFAVGRRDPRRTLVLDPVVGWATFLGGSSIDFPFGLALDGSGNVIVAGYTQSVNLPRANALQAALGGNYDGFVSRFSNAGTTLVSSTYIGGSGDDRIYGIAADAAGAVTFTGSSQSTNWPLVGAIQPVRAGAEDVVVGKLAASGTSLVYSTFLGGADIDVGQAVALASDGSAFVTGITYSSNFPLKNALYATRGGTRDAFVTKVNPGGTAWSWSTYLGGSAVDYATAVALDSAGNPVVAGYTQSTNFPVLNPYQGTFKGAADTFLSKFKGDGTALLWSTYFGGTSEDAPTAVGVDASGNVWFGGTTYSTDLPLANALQAINNAQFAGYIAEMDPAGSTLPFSTYFGGTGYTEVKALALDARGNVYVAGYADLNDFPVKDAVQPVLGGGGDAFATVIDVPSYAIRWSTFLGGASVESAYGIAVDPAGSVYVGGVTGSTNFPTVNPFQSVQAGNYDAFVVAIRDVPFPPSNCTAKLTGLTSIGVDWSDGSVAETGFAVERRIGGDPFTVRATIAPNVTTFSDTGLDPTTDYTYRVRAVNAVGNSPPSNEAGQSTPATPTFPPASPSGLDAAMVSPYEAALTWEDNSDNEDFFLVSRASGGGLFATRATPGLGTIAFDDDTLLPEGSYSWKVRAQNPLGPSLFTNTVSLTMPSTLSVAVTKGKIADRALIGKDAVALAGTFAYGEGARSAAFDPAAQSVVLRLGSLGDPPILSIAAGDAGWTLRKGKYTWKAPKGSTTKATVVVDPAVNAWTVKLGRFTLSAAPASPLRATLSLGTDTGHFEAAWTVPTKAGLIKYPVPVPKVK